MTFLKFQRKNIIILLLLLLSFSYSLAQNKNYNRRSDDYPTIVIGPEISGSIALSMNSSDELLTKFHYSIGGFINVRPVQAIGLESGLKYNNIINTQKFYEIPLSFYFFSKSGGAFIIGPDFLYQVLDGKTDFQKPKVGLTLGAGNQIAAIKFNLYPANLFSEEIKSYFGIGLCVKLIIFSK